MKNLFVLLSLLLSFGAHAEVKITQLPLGSAAVTTTNDVFPFVNVSAGVTKKMTLWDLVNIPAFVSTYAPISGATFTNPNIGVATGTSLALSTWLISSNSVSGQTSVVSAAGTTTLTKISTRTQTLTGTTTQTFTLPSATTLVVGWEFEFDNNSTGTLTVNANGGGAVATVPAGGNVSVKATSVSTAAGVWDKRFSMPSNAAYGTSGMVITGTLNTSAGITATNYASNSSSVSTPAYSVSSGSGIYNSAANQVGVTCNGVNCGNFTGTGTSIPGTLSATGAINTTSTGNSATHASNALYADGGISAKNALWSGDAVSGSGGAVRIRKDTGAQAWLAGILGSAAAVNYSIFDLVGGAERLQITPGGVVTLSGNLGIGTSPTSALDIIGSVSTGSGTVRVTDSTTDVTIKQGSFIGTSYTTANRPLGLLYFSTQSAANDIYIGGGNSLLNAATTIHLRTGATNNTQNGTDALSLGSTQAATFGGAILAPSLATSSAATTGTLCWTTGTGNINVDTTTTCLLSTRKIKTDIQDLDIGIDTIMKLRPVSYMLKKENNPMKLGRQVGMISEEVAEIDDRLVSRDAKGDPMGVRYQQLTAVLTKAVQEQQVQIQTLQKEIEEMKRGR